MSLEPRLDVDALGLNSVRTGEVDCSRLVWLYQWLYWHTGLKVAVVCIKCNKVLGTYLVADATAALIGTSLNPTADGSARDLGRI